MRARTGQKDTPAAHNKPQGCPGSVKSALLQKSAQGNTWRKTPALRHLFLRQDLCPDDGATPAIRRRETSLAQLLGRRESDLYHEPRRLRPAERLAGSVPRRSLACSLQSARLASGACPHAARSLACCQTRTSGTPKGSPAVSSLHSKAARLWRCWRMMSATRAQADMLS